MALSLAPISPKSSSFGSERQRKMWLATRILVTRRTLMTKTALFKLVVPVPVQELVSMKVTKRRLKNGLRTITVSSMRTP